MLACVYISLVQAARAAGRCWLHSFSLSPTYWATNLRKPTDCYYM